jgi:hypothetical protein
MLRAMTTPEEPANDRRAVPRHLRDGENDLLASTGVFGQRAMDARSRRVRGWAAALLATAAALAAGWFLLR